MTAAPPAASERGSTPAPPSSPSGQLVRSASVIGAATMTSRLLGLVRDQVLAYLFGAGNAMDAFYIGFRIPNLMRDLFAEGAMSAAFVPTFTRRLTTQGRTQAWQLGNQLINALLLVTGLIVVAGIFFAPQLVALLAADFDDVPGKLALTTQLTRTMLPFLSLVAIAAVLMGMLNSLQQFFTPALSPAMFNLAMIASGFALVPVMPSLGLPPITGMALGALVGGFGQVLLQWPALHRAGFRYRPILDPRDRGLREVLRLMGPGTLGLAAVQINLLVNTVLATGEGTGAVSWLSYAFRLMYLPIGLFGVSIATAALPTLARQAARQAPDEMRRTVSSGLRLMLMLNVPATVGLVALAAPIVALIFERGNFTATDTAATAAALTFYAPGLLGYSAVKIAVPTFYALKDSRTPALVSVASVGLNVALNLVLVRFMGFRGLALGTSIAALLNAAALLVLLRRRFEGLEARRIAVAFVKIAVASAVMGWAALATERWLATFWTDPTTWQRAIGVGSAIGVGVVVLTAAARVLRIEEFNEARRRLMARLSTPRSTV
ncbi:MAG: murein biosynthesis integral membrane protein MurJ [Vicinamibacterales bacterium]|nr:murein biosynthesis integral membrane protein MurJ [Vicinamibacterales bacterium]